MNPSTPEHETWTILPPQSLQAVIDDELNDRETPAALELAAPVAEPGEELVEEAVEEAGTAAETVHAGGGT